MIDESRDREKLLPTEKTSRIFKINNSSLDNIEYIRTWVETAFNEYKDQVNVKISLIRESFNSACGKFKIKIKLAYILNHLGWNCNIVRKLLKTHVGPSRIFRQTSYGM